MSERKPDTYHWVIGEDGDDPAIALWDGDTWTFPQHDFDGAYYLHHVFRVGIGGGLNSPPDEWVPDIKDAPPVYGPNLSISDMVHATLTNADVSRRLAENMTRNNALLRHLSKTEIEDAP